MTQTNHPQINHPQITQIAQIFGVQSSTDDADKSSADDEDATDFWVKSSADNADDTDFGHRKIKKIREAARRG